MIIILGYGYRYFCNRKDKYENQVALRIKEFKGSTENSGKFSTENSGKFSTENSGKFSVNQAMKILEPYIEKYGDRVERYFKIRTGLNFEDALKKIIEKNHVDSDELFIEKANVCDFTFMSGKEQEEYRQKNNSMLMYI